MLVGEIAYDIVFNQPIENNLHLVREFYANWDHRDPDHEVKIHGKVITFKSKDLNEFLGLPESDVEPLR